MEARTRRGTRGALLLIVMASLLVPGGTPAQAQGFVAEGTILAMNPASNFIGISETLFGNTCSYPPPGNGIDGYIFELPGETAAPTPFTAMATSSLGPYDLDVYFYSGGCDFLDGSVATEAADETGNIPAGARYVAVDAFIGLVTDVRLCVQVPDCAGAAPSGGAPPEPAPSASGSPAPSGSSSPSAPASPAPSPETSSAPPPPPSSEPPPAPPPTTEAPPPPPPPPPHVGSWTTTLASSRTRTVADQGFELAGHLRGDEACGTPADYTVAVARRTHGEDTFTTVATGIKVRGDGLWVAQLGARRSATYTAAVEANPRCSARSSDPVDVLVEARILVQSRVRCTGTVAGGVLPDYPDTPVVLEVKSRSKWAFVARRRLDESSSFRLPVNDCGSYRITWPKADVGNERGRIRFVAS